MTERSWPCQNGAKCLIPCFGCPHVNRVSENFALRVAAIKGYPVADTIWLKEPTPEQEAYLEEFERRANAPTQS